jgi:hypothetical protein
MAITPAQVRFQEERGRLRVVEVRRQSGRPLVAALHRALLAAGVVITSYQALPGSDGLRERLELASVDGEELDDSQSVNVRSAVLPLAFEED